MTDSGIRHGALKLPAVEIDGYNAELRDQGKFLGDHASGRAFRELLDDWRDKVRAVGDDPLGEVESGEISKRKLDKILLEGDPAAAGVVQGAIEDFAGAFAGVVERLLKLKEWKDTERIVVGGGLRQSRIGELAIGRAGVLLKAKKIDVDLHPIAHHPDEAGLIGALQLAPAWMFKGHDSVVAVDIGGSNFRTGLVLTNRKKKDDLSKAEVAALQLWRHADEPRKPGRERAVDRLVEMIETVIAAAQADKLQLAPFIGVGCPGVIGDDGTIEKGGQNLPGNWESERFNLPERLVEALPRIGEEETVVVMHNDAVVQGLSQVPYMQDVERWGVLTIGTGLGNARFTNRRREEG
jgi:predicted NBD/HSP70 family sugar kinase